MVQHVNSARWRPILDCVFALDEDAAAIARLQSPERFGKIVMTV